MLSPAEREQEDWKQAKEAYQKTPSNPKKRSAKKGESQGGTDSLKARKESVKRRKLPTASTATKKKKKKRWSWVLRKIDGDKLNLQIREDPCDTAGQLNNSGRRKGIWYISNPEILLYWTWIRCQQSTLNLPVGLKESPIREKSENEWYTL